MIIVVGVSVSGGLVLILFGLISVDVLDVECVGVVMFSVIEWCGVILFGLMWNICGKK